jgi:hypothetical protein
MHHSRLKVDVLAPELEHLPVPQRTPRAQLDREPQLVGHRLRDHTQLVEGGRMDLR